MSDNNIIEEYAIYEKPYKKNSDRIHSLPLYMQPESVLKDLFDDNKYVSVESLPEVVTTGSYNDLKDKPTIRYNEETGDLIIKL